MRSAITFITLAAGVTAAAVWVPWGGGDDGLAVVTSVGTGGVAQVERPDRDKSSVNAGSTAVDAAGPRFFGFPIAMIPAPVPVPRPAARPNTGPSASPSANPVENQRSISTAGAPVTIVAATNVAVMPGQAAVVAPLAARDSGRDQARLELIRNLQRELKRVGCYAGDVDGEWGNGSRRGLRAFMEQAKASMTNDVPDLIQLTLVRGHTGVACASPCPPERMSPGTVSPGTGQCLNGPMMASRRGTDMRTATGGLSNGAVAAPVAIPSRATAQAVTPLSLPLQAQPANSIATGAIEQTASVAPQIVLPPLTGRMTVGGPTPEPSDQPDLAAGEAAPLAKPVARPRPASQSAQRKDRAWTGTFFNN